MNYPRRILALDLETTGLNSQYDYITQIGAVVMEGGEVIGAPFYTHVQPSLDKTKITLGALAAQVGDIRTPEGQAGAAQWFAGIFESPAPKMVAAQFVSWLNQNKAVDLPIVAHNASFDMGFLSQFIYQQRTSFGQHQRLSPIWIDTISLAKLAMPGEGSYALNAVLLALGLPSRPDAHDALQDAILAGRIYDRLLNMLDADQTKPTGSTLQGAHPKTHK